MKVLYFIESLRAGGKERRIVELLKGLKNQYPTIQIEVVLTKNEIHYKEILDLEIPIHTIERKLLKKDPSLFLRFYLLARRFKPDIIHVWGHMVAFYSLPAKKLLGIPLINNEITDATPNQKLLGKSMVFKVSDQIIANTKAGLLAYGPPPSKSMVIYNGFNFNRLRALETPNAIRERLGVRTKYMVTMVASFSAYKDYPTFIKGAMEALNKLEDISFLCIGDGHYSELKAMVPTSLHHKILFPGKQTGVESIMNASDIGVLITDTRNHQEGISNALMEFMANGKPVIATGTGGSIELVEHDISGYLIKPFDHFQLGEAIITLLTNESKSKQMGQAARKRIENHFNIEHMVFSYYQVYERWMPAGK